MAIPGFGTATKSIGYAAAAAALLAFLCGRSFRRLDRVHLAAAAFLTWRIMSLLWSAEPTLTAERLLIDLQLFGSLILLHNFFKSTTDFVPVSRAYCLGGIISSTATIMAWHQGVASIQGRFAAGGFDPNELCVALCIGLPLAWRLGGEKSSIINIIVAGVYIPITCIAAVLTASRAGCICLATSCAGIIWTTRRRTSGKIVAIAVVGACIAAAAFVSPPEVLRRLGTTTAMLGAGNLNRRQDVWAAGVTVFLENPIVGVGAGAFRIAVGPILGRELVAHNTYISILTELGTIGLILFFALVAGICCRLPILETIDRRTVIATLCTWAIGASTLTWEQKKVTWFVVALVVLWISSAERERRIRSACPLIIRPEARCV